MLSKLLQRILDSSKIIENKNTKRSMQYHPPERSGRKNGFPPELLYMRVKKMQTQKGNR